MIYAQKGEKVTCTNGHVICTVAEDIELGDFHRDEMFEDWKQPEPERGASTGLCGKCRGEWFRKGPILHFEDGWRV